MFRIHILTICILIPGFIFAENSAKIKKMHTKSKSLSALILFSGDYKSKFQFDGAFQQNLQGIFVDSSDYVSNKECDLTADFQKVIYAKALHLKIVFQANCLLDQVKSKTVLSPEYIRIKDLKTYSSSLYLSERYKNVQFKILEYSD